MLLSMMIILAVTSTLLELMIAAKVPAWRRLSAKSPLFNLLNSLFLSFLVGIAFGAAGLIAMGSGVISTVLSVPGYQFLYWNYDSPYAQQYPGGLFKHKKKEFFTMIGNFFRLLYKVIWVLTFPIWGLFALQKKYSTFKSSFSSN